MHGIGSANLSDSDSCPSLSNLLKNYLGGDVSVNTIFDLSAAFINRAYYQKAIILLSSSPEVRSSAKGLFLLGRSYLGLLEPDLAVAHLNQSVKLAPNNFSSLHTLSLAYLELFQTKKAILILENLISIYPSSADAHNSIAVAYKYLGQFDKGSHFDIATQCNPTFYSAYRNRSLITDYNSDLEHFNAIQSLYQEKSLTDNQVSVQIGFAYARALEQRKDFRLATDVLVKANNAHLDQITPFEPPWKN